MWYFIPSMLTVQKDTYLEEYENIGTLVTAGGIGLWCDPSSLLFFSQSKIHWLNTDQQFYKKFLQSPRGRPR